MLPVVGCRLRFFESKNKGQIMKWQRVAGSGGNTWSGEGYVTAVFETPEGQRGVGGVHYTREIIPGNPWPGKDVALPFGPIRETAKLDSLVIDADPEFVR